jgi:hypothetical protein
VIAAASMPSRPAHPQVESDRKDEVKTREAKSTLTDLGLFFYILLIALVVSIISHYL